MLLVSGVQGSLIPLVSGAEWSLELVLWDVCLNCVSYCSAVFWGSVVVRWVVLFGLGVVVKN
jgi:hypothetical protein